MQTLVFRNMEKTTTLYSNLDMKETIPNFSFDKVTTVAVRDGFYEIMVKKSQEKVIPVARLPISQTAMIILEE